MNKVNKNLSKPIASSFSRYITKSSFVTGKPSFSRMLVSSDLPNTTRKTLKTILPKKLVVNILR